MLIKIGYEISSELKGPKTPMLAMLYVHPSWQKVYVSPFHLVRSLP